MNEELILKFDPWGSDGCYYSRLEDRMVTGAKEHVCYHCNETIAKGERQRMTRAKVGDSLHTFRWCRKCCEAMQDEWEHGGLTFHNRCGIGVPVDAEPTHHPGLCELYDEKVAADPKATHITLSDEEVEECLRLPAEPAGHLSPAQMEEFKRLAADDTVLAPKQRWHAFTWKAIPGVVWENFKLWFRGRLARR